MLHMMIIKNPQNIHEVFLNNLMIFICNLKIDLIMFKPHYVKIVSLNLILFMSLYFGLSFDISTHAVNILTLVYSSVMSKFCFRTS